MNELKSWYLQGLIARLDALESAQVQLASAPLLFARLFALAPLVSDAVEIATILDHSVYDALYLALARSLSAPLISDDERLIAACHGTPLATLVIPLRPAARPVTRRKGSPGGAT